MNVINGAVSISIVNNFATTTSRNNTGCTGAVLAYYRRHCL